MIASLPIVRNPVNGSILNPLPPHHSAQAATWDLALRKPMSASYSDAPRPPTGRTSLLYAVKRLELAVRSHIDDMLKPAGITALQYTALTVLERHDGRPAAQLARDSFVTPQSMADMVRTLEARGLIHRERNPRNGRELLIHLTEDGRQFLAKYAAPAADLEERMLRNLSTQQVDDFRRALAAAWRALCDQQPRPAASAGQLDRL
jgi:DNA-binding MarR family transcriptional regulator